MGENLREKEIKGDVVVSLLRGGAVVGEGVARILGIEHYPLLVVKVGAPFNEELAIGSLVENKVFWNTELLGKLRLSEKEIERQVEKAKEKQKEYKKALGDIFPDWEKVVAEKTVLLVDDGIATGTTAIAGKEFLKDKGAKKVVVVSPVAPSEIDKSLFDKFFVLVEDPFFVAVGEFYKDFSSVGFEKIKEIFGAKGA